MDQIMDVHTHMYARTHKASLSLLYLITSKLSRPAVLSKPTHTSFTIESLESTICNEKTEIFLNQFHTELKLQNNH